MATSYTIDSTAHIVRIECTGRSTLPDLELALLRLLCETEFKQGFGVLLEIGGESACLQPSHALAVIELITKRGDRLRTAIAVYVPPSLGIVPARLIAMLGRHHGLDVEAFEDRPAAARWLSDRVAKGSALAG